MLLMWRGFLEKSISLNLYAILTLFSYMKSSNLPNICSLSWNTWKMGSSLTTLSRKREWNKMMPAKYFNKLSVEYNIFINLGLSIEISNSKIYYWITIIQLELLILDSQTHIKLSRGSRLLVDLLVMQLHK